MKTLKRNLTVAMIALFVLGFASSDAFAQHGMGNKDRQGMKQKEARKCMNLPGLTDEQKEKIDQLKTNFMKEKQPLLNKMAVKKAELKELSTGDDVDMKAVHKKIEEINDLQETMMKKHATHRQEIRQQLNDKQRLIYDQHGHGMGMNMEKQGKGKLPRKFGKGKRVMHRHAKNCPMGAGYDDDND